MNLDGVYLGSRLLPNLDALELGAGDSAYVLSVGAPYRLWDQPGPGPVDGLGHAVPTLNNVPAMNRPGYWWVREAAPNPRWWTPSTWNVNPDAGDDEGPTLKTCQELYRRLYRAQLPTAIVANILGDVPDGDSLVLDIDSPRIANHVIKGLETVLTTQVVTDSTPTNMAGNLLNTITVDGCDLSPYIGKAVRVGGVKYATILACPSLGVAQLGLAYTTTNGAISDVVTGDVIEIVKRTKGPLALELHGSPSASVRPQFLNFSGAGFFYFRSTPYAQGFFDRCEFSPSTGGTFYGNVITTASIYRGGTAAFDHEGSTLGNRLTAATLLSLPGQGCLFTSPTINVVTSCTMRGSSLTASENVPIFFKGNNATVGLAAGQPGVLLTGYQAKLYMHGAWYGGGNDPAAEGAHMNLGTRVLYSGPAPTMDAGHNIIWPTGAVRSWAELPVHLDDETDAALINGA